MAVVLAVQALLFQDGGITALGANTLDMGVAASLAGYRRGRARLALAATLRARVVGGVLGAFAATLVAAVLTGLWLGLSGLYPLVPVVQLMLVSHVAIGLLEAALTGAVLATVVRWRPDLVRGVSAERSAAGPAVAGGLFGVAHRRRSLPLAVRVGAAGRPRSRRGAPRVRHARVRLVAGAVPGLRAAVRFVTRDRHGGRRARRHLLAAVVAWGVSRGVSPAGHDAHR